MITFCVQSDFILIKCTSIKSIATFNSCRQNLKLKGLQFYVFLSQQKILRLNLGNSKFGYRYKENFLDKMLPF